MVKNTSGGNKTKKKKRTRVVDIYNTENEEQHFGKIIKNMGGHFSILGLDNIERIGKLRNAVKRGPRLSKDSYIIYSLREFSDKNECDVIGIANPPQNIIKQFEGLDPKKKIDNIEFKESNNEFDNVDKIEIDIENTNKYCDMSMMIIENDDDGDEYYSVSNKIAQDYDECKNLMDSNIDFLEEIDNNNGDEIINVINEKNIIESTMKLNNNLEQNTHQNKNKQNKKDKQSKQNNIKELEQELDEIDEIDFDNINFDDI